MRPETVPPPARPALLVVDDETYNADLMVRTFHRTARVRCVTDGAEALAALAEEPAALVLVDHRLGLGGGTGLDLAHTIRARWPITAIVVVTGYADLPLLHDALAAGAIDALVAKPWSPAELRRQVAELLAARRAAALG